MAVPAPDILYAFLDADSGKTVQNYGTGADGAVNPDAGCVENSQFAYSTGPSPFNGNFESFDQNGSNMAWINTGPITLATAPNAICLAFAIDLDSFHSTGGFIYSSSSGSNATNGDVTVRALAPTTSGWKLTVLGRNTTASTAPTYSVDDIPFGTLVKVAIVLDRSTPSSTILKVCPSYGPDADTVVSQASVNTSSLVYYADTGYIGMSHASANNFGWDGRMPFFAYDRANVWTSQNLLDIVSDPINNITDFPGASAHPIPIFMNQYRHRR